MRGEHKAVVGFALQGVDAPSERGGRGSGGHGSSQVCLTLRVVQPVGNGRLPAWVISE
jgi:hypothetical protein